MLYQAIFHKYGEHIHIPVEAESEAQAFGIAKRENVQLESWPLTIKPVKEGEEARDDRAELKFVAERKMGRPSQGRSRRLQVNVTPDLAFWLATQYQDEDKSISDVVFRLLEQVRSGKDNDHV